MSGEDSAEKSFDPTQKKLDDARKKGEIPRSTDLNTAAAYAGLILAAMIWGKQSLLSIGTVLQSVLANAGQPSFAEGSGGGTTYLGALVAALVPGVGVWMLLPAVGVVIALISQRGLVFAPDKLQPKLDRVSPLSNAKQKFGLTGIVEFSKSAAKLTVVSIVLALFLVGRIAPIVTSSQVEAQIGIALLLSLCRDFLVLVLVIAAAFAAIDLVWQHADFLRRNRMTRKEVTDEQKESEGDPHMKGQRRQRGYDIAMNKMLSDVPDADVVIVNPTHYAVALKWSRSRGAAPVCVAKGVDEIAARIRETAMEAGVPVHRDPPTARAIFATVEIGREIQPDHYRAVAAAIRFADRIKARAKPR